MDVSHGVDPGAFRRAQRLFSDGQHASSLFDYRFEADIVLPVVVGGQGGRVVIGCPTCEALLRVPDLRSTT